MAKQKLSALAAPFQGKWRIAEMDVWDNEAIDLLGPAFIAFKGQEGEMRFIALTAWLEVRYDARKGGPVAEFSWEGDDEGDQRSGRGARNRRTPRRPRLHPPRRRFRLRLRTVVSSSTAC